MIPENSSERHRVNLWLVVFAAVTILAIFNTNRYYTSELAEGKDSSFGYYLIMETTGAYTVLVLLPFVLRYFKCFPIQRRNRTVRIPLHLLGSIVFGIAHTLLMYISRVIIFQIAGLGVYDYGRWIYRFPMEYSHQFFVYWTIYGIFLFIKYLREYQEQRIRASKLEEQLTRARLDALQMQLHPHFLFNTLNLISSTMYEDIKAADGMMADLSDLLRVTLNGKMSGEHTLKRELEILRHYVNIMKARFRDRLSIRFDIEKRSFEALVPGFILQPLVENAIKYGMESLKKVDVRISAHSEAGRLLLRVEDDGPGIPDQASSRPNDGVGLLNTRERLETLYGDAQQFRLDNRDGGGLNVSMELPFHSAKDEVCDGGNRNTHRR